MAKARIWGAPNEDEMAKGLIVINCPGCKNHHWLHTKLMPDGSPGWGFNQDFEKPTFSPSLLVRTGSFASPNFIDPPDAPPTICHSFITDGKIQFLGDCTHELKNQTVELPDID